MKEAIAYFGTIPMIYNNIGLINHIDNKNIYGSVLFIQYNYNHPVYIYIRLHGLPNGYHGFHIHEHELTKKLLKYNDCCNHLGGHFNSGNSIWSINNTNGTKHGCHTGDLCFNILSNKGLAIKNYIDYNISLYKSSPHNIVNRSLVIHKDKDDKGKGNNIESLITGNAGKRIACSNIVYI